MSRNRTHRKRRLGGAIPLPLALLMVCYVVVNLYPFLWMVGTSFKDKTESFTTSGPIPDTWTTVGWSSVWEQLDAASALKNSLIYTGASMILVLTIYPMAAFVLAHVKFRGREVLFAALVSGLLVPNIVLLVPIVILAQETHLVNTWPGVLLPTISAAGPIPLYLMRNYFRLLPHDLLEAAKLDGASYFTAFRRIFLPLSVPALTTVSILTLVYVWNAYILPSLLLTDESMFTLPLRLFSLDASGNPGRNELMAGAILVILPLIAAFLALQRYYIAGMTSGATKS